MEPAAAGGGTAVTGAAGSPAAVASKSPASPAQEDQSLFIVRYDARNRFRAQIFSLDGQPEYLCRAATKKL